MQDITILKRFSNSDRHLSIGRPAFSCPAFAIFVFCFLHLAIVVMAGYFIVQWYLPAATKLIFLAVACFASLWFFLQSAKKIFAKQKKTCL
jgi:CHASE2 domain-containing sensor protein